MSLAVEVQITTGLPGNSLPDFSALKIKVRLSKVLTGPVRFFVLLWFFPSVLDYCCSDSC